MTGWMGDVRLALRVQPILGRSFTADEQQPGRDHVVVLGHAIWQTQFAADPTIVGRRIQLDGEPYTVVGIMPSSFRLPGWAQLWTPLGWDAAERAVRGNHNYLVIARLKPGVSVATAQADMKTISARLQTAYPADDAGWGAVVLPLQDDIVSGVRSALLMLLGAVAFVLLIACANVANLVLGRSLARRQEVAIRSALGASRARLLGQMPDASRAAGSTWAMASGSVPATTARRAGRAHAGCWSASRSPAHSCCSSAQD